MTSEKTIRETDITRMLSDLEYGLRVLTDALNFIMAVPWYDSEVRDMISRDLRIIRSRLVEQQAELDSEKSGVR